MEKCIRDQQLTHLICSQRHHYYRINFHLVAGDQPNISKKATFEALCHIWFFARTFAILGHVSAPCYHMLLLLE